MRDAQIVARWAEARLALDIDQVDHFGSCSRQANQLCAQLGDFALAGCIIDCVSRGTGVRLVRG